MAAAIIPEGIQDDKAQHVIPFVLDLLKNHEAKYLSSSDSSSSVSSKIPPLIVGLTAPQGAGKSLLVYLLHSALTNPPHCLPTTIFSLDDFYLPHSGLQSLAQSHPSNPLLQHRGQPSTHDIPLVRDVFSSLRANKPTKIPQFDKALFNGQGDRVPESDWLQVNADPTNHIRIVLFEGWCVGFRPVSSSVLTAKHTSATAAANDPGTKYRGRLGHNTLENVAVINDALKQYDEITAQFDGLIHVDAEDPLYVYDWRLEQERNLVKAKGSGMTDEEVKTFVDGYYPSYELYVDGLREGIFNTLKREGLENDDDDDDDGTDAGRQLRLIVGKDRKVVKVERL